MEVKFARKEGNIHGESFPEEWTEKVKGLLEQTYQDQLKARNLIFDIHSEIYKDEILLIVSLLNANSPDEVLPTSFFLSVDITEKAKSNLNDNLVDALGPLLDQFFNSNGEEVNAPRWVEEDLNGQKIFYKISRENIRLTIQANNLLNQ